MEISKSANDSFYLNIIMNFVIIILGVALIVSLYVLFVYFYKKKEVVDKVDLSSGPKTIESTLVNAKGQRCAYSAWVYVNSWSNGQDKQLLSRGTNLNLYLDKNSPRLFCKVTTNVAGNPVNNVLLTANFPIQKWVYVIISFDNKVLDCYLDGKLVTSKQLSGSVESKDNLVLGGANSNNIFMAKVRGWEIPMDPQTAWSSYLDGNGISSAKNTDIPSYRVKMSILENDVEKTQFNVF